MHGSRRSVGQLLDGIAGVADLAVEVAVCPPFVYLAEAAARVSGTGIRLAAQSLSEYECGAYTGEVAGSMLADVGCRYVLVGHSERRRLFGETDHRIARQFERALTAGITPVLCVGEDAAERNAGTTLQVLGGMGFTFDHDVNLYLKRTHVLTRGLADRRTMLDRLVQRA